MEEQWGLELDAAMAAQSFVALSTRELEVLQLMASGHSNKEIAQILAISGNTVRNHVSTILRKLEVSDRTQAVVQALGNGWVRLDVEGEVQRRPPLMQEAAILSIWRNRTLLPHCRFCGDPIDDDGGLFDLAEMHAARRCLGHYPF